MESRLDGGASPDLPRVKKVGVKVHHLQVDALQRSHIIVIVGHVPRVATVDRAVLPYLGAAERIPRARTQAVHLGDVVVPLDRIPWNPWNAGVCHPRRSNA